MSAGKLARPSIGGLEGQLRIVRGMVQDRAHSLRNSVRTHRLLDLLTLQIRGLADERTCTDLIAKDLTSTVPGSPLSTSSS